MDSNRSKHADKRHRTIFGSEQGHVVIPAVVLLIGLAAIIGGIYDWRAIDKQRALLKAAANAAALDGAISLSFDSTSSSRLSFSSRALIAGHIGEQDFNANTQTDFRNKQVDISLTAPAKVRFPGPLSLIRTVNVTSRAALLTSGRTVCMLALPHKDTGAKGSISIGDNARLSADGCVLHADASSEDAFDISPLAKVEMMGLHRAAGDTPPAADTAETADIQLVPHTGDPLAGRPSTLSPDIPCDHEALTVTDHDTLSEGVYCGGLTIDGGTAELYAGTYILRDGPLIVTNGGRLRGEFVSFQLAGEDAEIRLDAASDVALTAPRAGDKAGLLFDGEPGQTMRTHLFASEDAHRLSGTIYLPGDRIEIDGATPMADRSDFTLLVAGEIAIAPGANLTLHTGYDLSDIPVPEGLGRIEKAVPILVTAPAS